MSGQARWGFTLLEVLLVIVIGSILLGIAIPHMDMAELRVRSTERELTLMLSAAQQRAVLHQHSVNVLFDTVSSLVIVHDDRDNDSERERGEAERIYPLEEGVRITRRGVPAGPVGDSTVSFGRRLGGLPVATFGRSGAASEAGGLYLGTLQSMGGTRPGHARALLLERATGRVTRFYLEGSQWRRVGVQ